jgi:hypothetical protein
MFFCIMAFISDTRLCCAPSMKLTIQATSDTVIREASEILALIGSLIVYRRGSFRKSAANPRRPKANRSSAHWQGADEKFWENRYHSGHI